MHAFIQRHDGVRALMQLEVALREATAAAKARGQGLLLVHRPVGTWAAPLDGALVDGVRVFVDADVSWEERTVVVCTAAPSAGTRLGFESALTDGVDDHGAAGVLTLRHPWWFTDADLARVQVMIAAWLPLCAARPDAPGVYALG